MCQILGEIVLISCAFVFKEGLDAHSFRAGVLFLANFCILATKEQSHCNSSKASFWEKKKIAQSHHIMRKKI
jgi:hypothetical protein